METGNKEKREPVNSNAQRPDILEKMISTFGGDTVSMYTQLGMLVVMGMNLAEHDPRRFNQVLVCALKAVEQHNSEAARLTRDTP